MSAKPSSSYTNGSTSARRRTHQNVGTGRTYTVEQKAAVIRVLNCKPTAYYDILGLKTIRSRNSDGEIKNAYRKLSLLTHPDKNGYNGANEAFKVVSTAYWILSDPNRKAQYDNIGDDPAVLTSQSATLIVSLYSVYVGQSGVPGRALLMPEQSCSSVIRPLIPFLVLFVLLVYAIVALDAAFSAAFFGP